MHARTDTATCTEGKLVTFCAVRVGSAVVEAEVVVLVYMRVRVSTSSPDRILPYELTSIRVEGTGSWGAVRTVVDGPDAIHHTGTFGNEVALICIVLSDSMRHCTKDRGWHPSCRTCQLHSEQYLTRASYAASPS